MFVRLFLSLFFIVAPTVNADAGQKLKANTGKPPATQATGSQIKSSAKPNCAKFTSDQAQTMTAIALAESGGETSRCK